MAVDHRGVLYVADQNNHRVQVFDFDKTEAIESIGSFGTGNANVRSPLDVAVDDDGDVYVVDMSNDRIQVFTSHGDPDRRWGTTGTGDGEFQSPSSVAVHDGRVYVTDGFNHRVQEFTTDGSFVRAWRSEGAGKGQFVIPRDVAADSSGQLFIADRGNNRFVRVTPR